MLNYQRVFPETHGFPELLDAHPPVHAMSWPRCILILNGHQTIARPRPSRGVARLQNSGTNKGPSFLQGGAP